MDKARQYNPLDMGYTGTAGKEPPQGIRVQSGIVDSMYAGIRQGYQPTHSILDDSNPPQGGSGHHKAALATTRRLWSGIGQTKE